MARLSFAEPILTAAADWRDECLIHDGSVFTNERLWKPENVDELVRYFVQNLDMGEGDFFSKLESQLGAAAPSAKRLAAEMFWVMYLMVSPSAMGAETKRYQIRQVWGWSGEELSEDHPLLGDLLDRGVANTGMGYNTHRWRELRYFITLLADFKALDEHGRRDLVVNPWRFAEWLESREHASGRQLRHILLFLLFPEHFDRIATASHKRQVVRTYRKKWDENPEDFPYSDRVALDREMLRVRERLAEEYGRDPQDVDFYGSEIEDEWRDKEPPPPPGKETAWPDKEAARKWLRERFGDKGVWVISAGGGGRLWREFRDRELIAIGWDYLGDLTERSSRDEVQELIAEEKGRENPVMDSLAVWQFAHEMEPGDIVIAKKGNSLLYGWGVITGDYTYEPERAEYQHVRSVKWKETGSWELAGDQKITPKTLTEFRSYPQWTRWAFARMEGEEIGGKKGDPDGKDPVRDALKDLFLEPSDFSGILDSMGRRRNVILQGPPGVGKTFIARRLAYALIGRKAPERVQLVQFHQSYAYEDFIQGWRPNKTGGFDLQDGIFHRFCARAREDEDDAPFVFIIDEVNRGNLSRIFGELMMLIEADKRGPAHSVPLTYSRGETFYVPENVHVLGLMNTADRSLAMVDYALRRRFGFIDLEPAFGAERFTQYLLRENVPNDVVSMINERMEELNHAIREDRRNLGPGFEIGHSYFVPTGDEDTLDRSWYDAVIETEIAPLLREYWFDQPDKMDQHLARLLR